MAHSQQPSLHFVGLLSRGHMSSYRAESVWSSIQEVPLAGLPSLENSLNVQVFSIPSRLGESWLRP